MSKLVGRYAATVLTAAFILISTTVSWAVEESEAGSYTQVIPGTLVKFDMVKIPGGELAVPDPDKPGTTIKMKIPPMWVGKTEVTWDEYDVFVYRLDEPETTAPGEEKKDALSRPSKPYGAADRGFGHKGYPAINVSYVGARQYCKWLSQKTGKNYRLPTEVEWEYACRAGAPSPGADTIKQYAWVWEEKTHPVAKKSPNAWGLYDMLGNVAEWCTDIKGKPVTCGGSWQDMAKDVSPSLRAYQDDSWRATDPQNPKSIWWLSDGPFVGFRIIRIESEGEVGNEQSEK